MRIPTIEGVIERRILINYRVDPEVLGRQLPAPFRPLCVGRWGVAGVCLIRLAEVRPKGLPRRWGIASENAAHRFAVEWDVAGRRQTGVYIPRRDTSSWANAWAGGRIFPGVHHRADFDVTEDVDHYRIDIASRDRQMRLSIDAARADVLPARSIFPSLADASAFFAAGSLGYSPAARDDEFDGLELITPNWQVAPLAVRRVTSSYFDDPNPFPPGSIEFDHALLMRDRPVKKRFQLEMTRDEGQKQHCSEADLPIPKAQVQRFRCDNRS